MKEIFPDSPEIKEVFRRIEVLEKQIICSHFFIPLGAFPYEKYECKYCHIIKNA